MPFPCLWLTYQDKYVDLTSSSTQWTGKVKGTWELLCVCYSMSVGTILALTACCLALFVFEITCQVVVIVFVLSMRCLWSRCKPKPDKSQANRLPGRWTVLLRLWCKSWCVRLNYSIACSVCLESSFPVTKLTKHISLSVGKIETIKIDLEMIQSRLSSLITKSSSTTNSLISHIPSRKDRSNKKCSKGMTFNLDARPGWYLDDNRLVHQWTRLK